MYKEYQRSPCFCGWNKWTNSTDHFRLHLHRLLHKPVVLTVGGEGGAPVSWRCFFFAFHFLNVISDAHQFKVLHFTLYHAPGHALQDCLQFRLVSFLLFIIVVFVFVTVINVTFGCLSHVLQPQEAMNCAAQKMALRKKNKLWLPTDECTYWQIKPWSTEWIPVAPGGRLGLRALWCMVPVSPGAKGPVQTRSSVSATDTDTQTWREADIHINRQVETSTSFTSHRPVRRGFAWWSWQAESCVGEHRRTPETGKSAIPTIKKEKYNKQTNKTQIPHLIKHKADVSLLAQAAAQAAEDLQTKRFIGSRVVTCMNFHLDLCWVISKILNRSKLMTKSNVNWKQKSCYEVTCNFDWLDNAAFNYKHVYCPLASPDSCCFSSLHFCFICTETCGLYS